MDVACEGDIVGAVVLNAAVKLLLCRCAKAATAAIVSVGFAGANDVAELNAGVKFVAATDETAAIVSDGVAGATDVVEGDAMLDNNDKDEITEYSEGERLTVDIASVDIASSAAGFGSG